MARTIRNLGELIGLLNRGRFVEKCNEELERVMMALEDLPEQKGKAKITLEITIARQQELVNIPPGCESQAAGKRHVLGNALLGKRRGTFGRASEPTRHVCRAAQGRPGAHARPRRARACGPERLSDPRSITSL